MNKDKTKETILVIVIGFLVVYLVFSLKWALYTSLSVGIIGILSTALSKKIEWVWMQLTKVLSYIVPNILLGLLFFLFLSPIALLSRLFKKDPLMLSNKYKSYFIDVQKPIDKASFEKIW
jgi:hypothetical protein